MLFGKELDIEFKKSFRSSIVGNIPLPSSVPSVEFHISLTKNVSCSAPSTNIFKNCVALTFVLTLSTQSMITFLE